MSWMAEAWDKVSADYAGRQAREIEQVHYGPWAPDEADLQLLGPVRGHRVLDLGCGAGQCAVALAREGAQVTGVDASEQQLHRARQAAAQAAQAISFLQADAADLSMLPSGEWALILSIFALQYVADLAPALAECARLLTPGGRLIISTEHPTRALFFDTEEDELSPTPVRSYFDQSPLVWRFGATDVAMCSFHRTMGQWIDHLTNAGFTLERLLEPTPPMELLDDLWPEDSALAPLRDVPHSVIFVARRQDT